MRKIRQIVALLICIAIATSLFTFSVTSVTAEESLAKITVTEEDNLLIEKLEALGVIKNSYAADSYVTRRQMAEIIRQYMGLPEETSGSGKKQFNDVTADDPSYGAISALCDLEVISGDENNNFKPDAYLNYNEAVVFVINAVGHKYFALREGGFPTGYMRVAIKHNMLKNLSMTNGDDKIPLIDVYRMLDAALSSATVDSQYYGDGSVRYTISETENFLSQNYGIRKYQGTVTGNEFTNLYSTNFEINRDQIEIDRVVYDTPGYFYGYFLGYSVYYYVKHTSEGDEMIYIEEMPKKNSTVVVDTEDILLSKVTSSKIYYLPDGDEDKEKHINLDDVVDVVYNNQWYNNYGTIKGVMPINGYIKALDNDNDGVCEILFVYDYTIAVVSSVDSYDEKIFDKMTNQELDLSTNVRRVDVISSKSQASVPFATIQKEDVLNIAEGRGTDKVVTIYVCDKTVNGKITGYSNTDGYEIDGAYYKKSYNYDSIVNSERVFPELAVGLSGTFHLDMNGNIAGYKYSSVDDGALFAAVAGVDYNENSTMNRDIKVKVFTSDGKFVEAPLAKKVKVDGFSYDMNDMSDCNRVLSILCKNYQENGKYIVYDSYVIRYKISTDEEITFIDTGAVGGAGNLNEFADHWPYTATRIGVALFAPSTEDTASVAVFAGVSSDVVVFTTPLAGELSDETGYSVANTWKNDHSYANPAHKDVNFSSNTTLMDNLSAYHMAQDDTLMLCAAIVRGGGISAGIDDEPGICVVTEMTSSVDEDSNSTKTLYQGDEKLGQLAQSITVDKLGVATLYTQEQFVANIDNIIGEGSVIRYGLDNSGYISQIAVISDYDAETGVITPTFKADGSFIRNAYMYAWSKSNVGVAEIITYDKANGYMDFKSGDYTFKSTLDSIESLKIYDTSTGKIRNALPSEIRDGDKCVLRLRIYYRVYDMIIFR